VNSARITWEPRPEFGEDPLVSSGTIRKTLQGPDGVTYVVDTRHKLLADLVNPSEDVERSFIMVHSSRVTSFQE
jgi:hypothetical protein